MTNSKPIYLQLQIFQCFLALGPLCLASLPSAMLEMWHIVVQGWGQALGNSRCMSPLVYLPLFPYQAVCFYFLFFVP